MNLRTARGWALVGTILLYTIFITIAAGLLLGNPIPGASLPGIIGLVALVAMLIYVWWTRRQHAIH